MKRVLFVRSGGGFPGLDIHAGIWLALEEQGIRPTEVHGTSAGAIVSGIHASGHSAEHAVSIVRGLCDSDLRRQVALWKLRLPWIDYILHNMPILDLLYQLCSERYEDLVMPLRAWATRYDTGAPVNVAHPEIARRPAEACMASSSICGIFPPVRLIDGLYVDGGVRCNLPLPPDWTSYDEVWLLIASGRPREYPKRRGVLTHLVRNVHYLMQDQIEDVLVATHGSPRVNVVWPKIGAETGMLHFDHGLIDKAYRHTIETLKCMEVADAND